MFGVPRGDRIGLNISSERGIVMHTPKIRSKRGPEYLIQQRIIKYLQERGWFVKIITASMYLSGMPDLFACHRIFGIKFIEVKYEKRWKFTVQQKETFPQLLGHGCPIYILYEADAANYKKLFKECNCPAYLALKGY